MSKITEDEKSRRLILHLEAKEKGLTLTFLASVAGSSVSLLSKWFNGQCNINENIENVVTQTIKQSKKFVYKRVKVYLDE